MRARGSGRPVVQVGEGFALGDAGRYPGPERADAFRGLGVSVGDAHDPDGTVGRLVAAGVDSAERARTRCVTDVVGEQWWPDDVNAALAEGRRRCTTGTARHPPLTSEYDPEPPRPHPPGGAVRRPRRGERTHRAGPSRARNRLARLSGQHRRWEHPPVPTQRRRMDRRAHPDPRRSSRSSQGAARRRAGGSADHGRVGAGRRTGGHLDAPCRAGSADAYRTNRGADSGIDMRGTSVVDN